MHPVVVHARLQRLLVRAVRRIGAECRLTLRAADRIAPAPEHGGTVPLGHAHIISARHWNRLEAEEGAAVGGGRRERRS